MLQNWCYTFHSICQNTFLTLTFCPVRFVKLDKMRKKRPQSFLYWKCFFFFKNLRFQQPLRSWRIDFKISTVKVKIPCGPLKSFFEVWHTRQNGENWARNFCHRVRTAVFWKFCFYGPLRSQKRDFIFCTILVKKPRGPLKIVLKVFHTR